MELSNREGGHIFIGIDDFGNVLGVKPSSTDKIIKEFVTTINNSNKMFPPLYLVPEEIEIDGRKILHIYVPSGTQACGCGGKIYDNGFGMLDINKFEPFVKNPVISKVFREVSLADELGSGMRNTYKYTKLYSGGVPEFVEGDVF